MEAEPIQWLNEDKTGSSRAADKLRLYKEPILNDWENQVRQKLPHARKESRLVLLNSLPEFLNNLEEALRNPLRETHSKVVTIAKTHGGERAHSSSYSIEEALDEYNILRKVIIDALEKTGTLRLQECKIIDEAINTGLIEAASEFSKLQLEKVKKAKQEVETERSLLQRTIEQMLASQSKLAESEERLKLALTASKVGIFDLNLETNAINWTEEESLIFGFSSEYLQTTLDQVTARIVSEDLPRVRLAMNRAIEEKGEYKEEFRVIWPNGTLRWLQGTGRVLVGPNGKPTRLIGINIDITEKRESEEAIIRAAHQLKVITDCQPTLIAYIDTNYVYQFANKAYERWFEKKEEEMRGRTMEEVLGRSTFLELKPYLDQALRGQATRFEKEVHYEKDGTRYIQGSYTPDADQDGTIRGIFVSVFDVTELHRTNELLRQSKEKYQALTDLSPLMIFATDRNGNHTYANRAWHEYTGIKDTESVGNHWLSRIHPEDRDKAQLLWNETLLNHTFYQQDIRIQRASDQSYRWIRMKARPVFNSQGEVDQWVGVGIDIHEEREQETRLRESENLFRILAQSLPQLAWIADSTGAIYWYNQRWFDFTGTTLEQVKGWGWKKVHHPEHVDRVVQKISECFSKGIPWEDTFPLRNINNEWHWFLSRALPIKDNQGKIIFWIGTNTDISEQVKSEEERKALIQILKQEKEVREQFVNTLSHDLRTPLTAIKTAAQLANRASEDQRVQMLTARILENANRSDRMIQDLLDVGRIKAGQPIPLNMRKIDLAAVVRLTLEDLATISGDRFRLMSPDQLPAFLCPSSIRRIIENLCLNAVKYGSPHTPITVTLIPTDDKIELRVHNEGPPLPEEERQRLFQAFHRTKAAEVSKTLGWGIGLTIVKGLTETQGGQVTFRSEAGFGVEFIITLKKWNY